MSQTLLYCLDILDITTDSLIERESNEIQYIIYKQYKKNMLIFHPDKHITNNPIFCQELNNAKTFLIEHLDELSTLHKELLRIKQNQLLSASIREYTTNICETVTPWIDHCLPKTCSTKIQTALSHVDCFLDFMDDNLIAESYKYVMKIKT